VSLKKGIPYLLQAVEPLNKEVELTLVGGVAPEMLSVLPRFRQHRHMGYMSKQKLREVYLEHDLLVMPTLGDSFGFVTLEAMGTGMPVVASMHAGAPVPDEDWRVPVRDPEALRSRILAYHRDREMLQYHAAVGAEFVKDFRPEDYRRRAGELFMEMLK
jgi:glycosyltransferase involved in cell wall biosynthesis